MVLDLHIPYIILFGGVRTRKREHVDFMKSVCSVKWNVASVCVIIASFLCPYAARNTFWEPSLFSFLPTLWSRYSYSYSSIPILQMKETWGPEGLRSVVQGHSALKWLSCAWTQVHLNTELILSLISWVVLEHSNAGGGAGAATLFEHKGNGAGGIEVASLVAWIPSATCEFPPRPLAFSSVSPVPHLLRCASSLSWPGSHMLPGPVQTSP